MTKFNKRVLAVAIAGAIMLPGAASAATLAYNGNKQITFAKDLIVNDGTTIYTPANLRLGSETTDAANIATVNNTAPATRNVRVKVTLTNGAKFDTTADATTLVQGFRVGAELGASAVSITDNVNTLGAYDADGTAGAGAAVSLIVGTPYYSASGQELNFEFTAPGNGLDSAAAADYAVELNSMQITSLLQGLYTGSSVGAEITAQNSAGQLILASKAEVAKSAWGITATNVASTEGLKRIDVAACTSPQVSANRTRFSPTGAVGGSCIAAAVPATEQLFNAGGVKLDITKAATTNAGAATYINNYSAVALNPEYSVAGTATWTFGVAGTNLAAFTGDIFLSVNANCSTADLVGTIAAGNASASFSVPQTSPLVSNLGSTLADKSETLHVCLRGDDADTLIPQTLSGSGSVNYNLATQRVNPPAFTFSLLPLLLNGTNITFQNVNPAANPNAQSFLRITNHNAFACPITIDAKDDAGVYTADSNNTVKFTIPAQGSKQFNIDQLEAGTVSGATGMLGDGTGKWYVRVTAECANVVGSAWARTAADGSISNMTDERNDDTNLFGR